MRKVKRLQSNTRSFGLSLPIELASQVDRAAEATDTSRGFVVAEALRRYFKSQEESPEAA
ncbi:MAG: hypothetical protein F6J95_007690 [Leptolyngbya sp. SIO1E4]|nr:hypothetical protein [Leptolyngbya sp. SIO1E4]